MELQNLYEKAGIDSKVYDFCSQIEEGLKERFAEIDKTAEYNQMKVLRAMQQHKVSAGCFESSTGYGYDDLGRETLEDVYASVFEAESALVRPQLTCGTHALTVALSANLRPGDELLSPVGKPYDTLEGVIGIGDNAAPGSLKEFGVTYRQVDLKEDGSFDFDSIRAALNDKTKLVTIQRSKGYATRPTLSVERIGELIAFIKSIRPDVICMVDNCYGAFVCDQEPTHLGADVCVGSLIKNLGGGLAPTGGYIVGTDRAIGRIEARLTAPGIGREAGSYAASYQPFYQGLFMAPHTVAQALKTPVLASRFFEKIGLKTSPAYDAPRADIIQAVEMGTPERLIALCRGIQAASPIDSFVVPEPSEMPGYADPVIMAAGTFVGGASIELSTDAPMRAPYIAYMQGALTYEHGKIALMRVLEYLHADGCI